MSDFFYKTSEKLKFQNLNIKKKDPNRPWGGFFDIDEDDFKKFIDLYFKGISINDYKSLGKLSPKILIIAPNKRLSWQYHHRRSEIWKVTSGEIKVVTSHDDVERNHVLLHKGDEINISKGERHRIIGTDDYAIVAEIWIHTDKDNPSNEDDIVRVQDDFNRK